jgi:hypothetical protein
VEILTLVTALERVPGADLRGGDRVVVAPPAGSPWGRWQAYRVNGGEPDRISLYPLGVGHPVSMPRRATFVRFRP